MSHGMMVREAAAMRDAGETIEAVVAHLDIYRAHIQSLFVPSDSREPHQERALHQGRRVRELPSRHQGPARLGRERCDRARPQGQGDAQGLLLHREGQSRRPMVPTPMSWRRSTRCATGRVASGCSSR
jgi:hypothetical protein